MAEAIDQDFWIMSLAPIRLLYTSPSARRIWGFDPESNENPERIIDRVHPDDRLAFARVFAAMHGGVHESEYRILHPSGTIRWLKSRVFPVRNTAGEIYRIAGVTEDITSRKEAELELEHHRGFERLITTLSTDFVNLTADRMEDGFRNALEQLAGLAGADRAAILLLDESERVLVPRFNWAAPGKTTLTPDPIPFDDDNPIRLALDRDGIVVIEDVGAMPEAIADTRERLLATGLGSFVDVPLLIAGQLIGLLGFGSTESGKRWAPSLTRLLEISAQMFANAVDRMRADEAMRRHREELAHVLRVGTMGQLASGIAHELNQPLSAIISYAQGCRRRIASGETAGAELDDALARVVEQAVRAAAVIKSLRAMVRKGEAPREWHDLNTLVRDAVALMEGEVARAKLGVAFDLAPAIPRVQVNAVQIEQVVTNLVRNAIEAMTDGHAGARREVRIATRLHDESVEVSVADQGPGVSPLHADRLFDDFYTTKLGGIGLGLSISRSLIRSHGGDLWFDRDAASGATFRFTLPSATGA
jgi:two-component system sensor kinase FixL